MNSIKTRSQFRKSGILDPEESLKRKKLKRSSDLFSENEENEFPNSNLEFSQNKFHEQEYFSKTLFNTPKDNIKIQSLRTDSLKTEATLNNKDSDSKYSVSEFQLIDDNIQNDVSDFIDSCTENNLESSNDDNLQIKELQLPYHCEKLIESFEYLEYVIRDLLLLNKPLYWVIIKEACITSFKKSLELDSLRRIVYFVPELYQLKFEKNPGNGNKELKIIIISEEKERKQRGNFSVYRFKDDIRLRKMILVREIEDYVKKVQYFCLKKIGLEKMASETERNREWHPEFKKNLNSVPLSPMCQLPKEYQNETKPMNVNDILMSNEKQKKFKKLERSLEKYRKSQIDITNSEDEEIKNEYGLSNKFLLLV